MDEKITYQADEKITYQAAFCAALTGLIMKGFDSEDAVNRAHKFAGWALDRAHSDGDLETDTDRQKAVQAEAARQTSKPSSLGLQRPAGV